MPAEGSTAGDFTVNLPSTDQAPAAGGYNHKTSLISYNDKGEKITLDVYFTKTGADEWNVSVKNAADGVEIGTTVLNFDPTTGDLVSGGNVAVNLGAYGGQTLNLNLGGSTQRAGDYTISQAVINGQAPSSIKGVDVGNDGAVVAVYENGTQKVLYRIPLANVASPDRMTVRERQHIPAQCGIRRCPPWLPAGRWHGQDHVRHAGGIQCRYSAGADRHDRGERSYTANSKVFQTGFELMDVLVI
ncbi:flagellar hook protein FlgE [Brucella melitensis]|nr:flagellar hook protein FlgE [Brucella melitensis]